MAKIQEITKYLTSSKNCKELNMSAPGQNRMTISLRPAWATQSPCLKITKMPSYIIFCSEYVPTKPSVNIETSAQTASFRDGAVQVRHMLGGQTRLVKL